MDHQWLSSEWVEVDKDSNLAVAMINVDLSPTYMQQRKLTQ